MKSTDSTQTPRIVDFAKEREIQEITRILRTWPYDFLAKLLWELRKLIPPDESVPRLGPEPRLSLVDQSQRLR